MSPEKNKKKKASPEEIRRVLEEELQKPDLDVKVAVEERSPDNSGSDIYVELDEEEQPQAFDEKEL